MIVEIVGRPNEPMVSLFEAKAGDILENMLVQAVPFHYFLRTTTGAVRLEDSTDHVLGDFRGTKDFRILPKGTKLEITI